jgi:hypothetical protein
MRAERTRCYSAGISNAKEDVMAKGQMRSNKEKKKPKADHNKPQKGAATAGGQTKPTFAPAGKK